MTMKAQVRTDASGNITVHMVGGLDYENSTPFRNELEFLTKENPHSQVTLDMSGVDFVGSSGIGHFVETVKILNQKKDQIRLMNVKTEFMKVFKLYDFDALDTIMMEFDTDDTENLSPMFSNRKKTFQN